MIYSETEVEPTHWVDKVVIGVPILLVGLAGNVLLFIHILNSNPFADTMSLFVSLMVAAYGVVANLFVLVGLKKLFGERPVFNRIIGHNLKRLTLILFGTTLLTIVVALMASALP